jgi:amino acid adenylation domain-containing protein
MKPNTSLNQNNTFNPFNGPAIEHLIYTTQPQAEIWIADKMGGEDANRAYNESVSLILRGNLNKDGIDYAIQHLIKRHEALRATFSTNGQIMTVFEDMKVNMFYQNISNLQPTQKENFISNYLSGDANFNFNLNKGPLIKFGLIKLEEHEYQLIITGHHIVCDGWSMGIILEELGRLYSAFVNGTVPNLPKAESFSEYAELVNKFIETDEFESTQNYWLDQYKESVPVVTMPTDFPRPQLRTFNSNRLDFPIDYTLVAELKKIGVKSGASFVTTLMTAFEVFLYYQTGQDDLVLGLPAAGQSLTGKNQLVGHCVNLLPLRSKINPDEAFNLHLKNRKNEIFDAFEYQQFSFGQLIQKLGIARDPSRVPLVPIVFNIDMAMAKAVAFEGLHFKLKSNPRAFETFEIFLNATGTENELILEWSYNTSLFKASTIQQMMADFKQLLFKIVESPNIKINQIFEVDFSPYNTLNNTSSAYPDLPLHELLAQQAKITPSKTAVKFGDSDISYQDLEKRTHQLARCLSNQGVKPGDFVAVSLPRSIDLVITLMAIMETGAAYLPLDPGYPVKRLEFMIDDSESKFIISKEDFLKTHNFSAQPLIFEELIAQSASFSEEPIELKVSNDAVAYLLYTSGSTGKPKGVTITHKNLVNLLLSVLKEPGVQKNDVVLSITTISFDIAMAELFLPLLTGAKLVLTTEETSKDTRILLDVITNEGITIMQATPATWQMLLDSGWNRHLPIKAISTGEALPISLAKKIVSKVNELWNMYGPTETTIWSAYKKINVNDELIAIGKPINNTQLYIIDEQSNLVAPGKIGELCIAGDGLAKGYWKRPELTSEKFIKLSFHNNSNIRLYKTGDLAKLLPSGDVLCLGRIDQQIKIRGQRIELGEIEAVLDSLKGVLSSVVSVNNDQLFATVIPEVFDEDENNNRLINWKEILKQQLPSHMIPQQFNFVKEFPKTLNGKVDRKALSELLPKKNNQTDVVEASTPSEKIISDIWKECLELDKIDVNSDFFEIGGHSLVGVKVMAKLEKETGKRLPLVGLLKHATIKKFAAYMDSEFFNWDSLVPLKPEGTKPPLYIVHGANHHVLIFNALAQGLSKDQPVYGLQSRGLNGITEPHDDIDQMAADYISEILASNPNGPYALAGFSYGGIVAFEMARQLLAQGKKVTILAQFDTYVFPQYYFKSQFMKQCISAAYLIGKIIFVIANMFSSKKNFIRRTELIKLQIKGWYLRLKYGKEKQFEMQFNVPIKMQTNHNKATAKYTITPQDIVIDLFRANEEVNLVHDHKYLGWTKMATKGIRKHMVVGNHVDMFEKPHVKDFAGKLQYVLDNHNLNNYE